VRCVQIEDFDNVLWVLFGRKVLMFIAHRVEHILKSLVFALDYN